MTTNFEKDVEVYSKILHKNINVSNVPMHIYGKTRYMDVDELGAFMVAEWIDFKPKKLIDEERQELEYMRKRGIPYIKFTNGKWVADNFNLIEKYPQLDITQSYDIAWLLDNDGETIIYEEDINFNHAKKNHIELNYFANTESNIEFKFSGVDDISKIYNRTIFGTRNAKNKNAFYLMCLADGDLRVGFGDRVTRISYNYNNFVNNSVTIKLIDKVFSIQINNGEEVNLGEVNFDEFVSDLKLVFGGLRSGEAITSFVNLNLNYLKVWDNINSLSLKPMYSNKVKVLYDEVNKVEYELKVI